MNPQVSGSPLWRGGSRSLCTFILLSMLLGGCATKSYVVLLPSPDGSVGEVVIKGEKGEQVLNQAGQAGSLDGRALKIEERQIKEDFGATIAALPKIPVRYLLYFSAGTTLTPQSESLIPKIISEAKTRPAVDISVIGHTDTVFTDPYNMQLALKRAGRVSELLTEKGLKANSMVIESHGKRNLLIPTPDNTWEPRNRRVEVSVR
ncbi:MAG: OmpA family protein [Azonexaceae bacterium]|nr:OmpA family protein [Azonexaceae bacterium]